MISKSCDLGKKNYKPIFSEISGESSAPSGNSTIVATCSFKYLNAVGLRTLISFSLLLKIKVY